MALLRSAARGDLKAVLRLAKALDSYNLPFDPKIIRKLIETSIRSFQGKMPRAKAKYLFVIEDPESKKIFGASLIVAKQGTTASPHIYFEKRKGLLHFGATSDGPTEIGGLILQRLYRRRKERYGKQLSWVRFLYMACHPERFGQKILAEFLPPLPKGKSLFWEAVGRRVTGLAYREADHLSVYTKQFIFDLFPKKIEISRLPGRVHTVLGKVAPQAEGAGRMLKRIGFRQMGRIEPFDGGPYYEAERTKITVIRKAVKAAFEKNESALTEGIRALLLLERKGKVRGCVGVCRFQKGKLFLDSQAAKLLAPKRREAILLVPFGR